jgi:siroheme synthase-like protein
MDSRRSISRRLPQPDAAQSTIRYQPLAIDLRDLPCLVVGGGKVGTHKATLLVHARARVTVVAPLILPALRVLLDTGHLCWLPERFAPRMLEGQRLIVAASDNKALNLRIARAAEYRGILCCNVSDAGRSRAIFPAVYSAGGVTVAVHSDGRNCRRSQEIRNEIAVWLARAIDRGSASR